MVTYMDMANCTVIKYISTIQYHSKVWALKCFLKISLMITKTVFIWSRIQLKQYYCEILLQHKILQLLQLFSILIYSFIPLTAKLNFQQPLLQSLVSYDSNMLIWCPKFVSSHYQHETALLLNILIETVWSLINLMHPSRIKVFIIFSKTDWS